MSNTAPKPIEEPAMIAMTNDILRRLDALAGITPGVVANCLSEGDWFTSKERFEEELPRTGVETPEDLFTTLDMKYRAVWHDYGADEGYQFSLSYGSEYGPPAYTNTYSLVRRASGAILLSICQGLDEELRGIPASAKPTLRPAMPAEIRELKEEVERLQESPSGGIRVVAAV